MTLVIDAGPLIALADRDDRLHEEVAQTLRAEPGSLVLPVLVAAEVDYLLGVRFGRLAQRMFLIDIAAGRYEVLCPGAADWRAIAEIDERYADLRLGVADLSIIVAAAHHDTHRILTFDHRHFRAARPVQGGSFSLLPMDGTAAG